MATLKNQNIEQELCPARQFIFDLSHEWTDFIGPVDERKDGHLQRRRVVRWFVRETVSSRSPYTCSNNQKIAPAAAIGKPLVTTLCEQLSHLGLAQIWV